ncbi:TonB-dependent receptor [Bermanella sp. R86510]|uniref:TonB-dependent receptor n=1 Tax=unclassified Bermanella TaxID=2627862 RepID=UPI0037C8B673
MKYSYPILFSSILLANQALANDLPQSDTAQLDTVNVTADFRQTDVMEIPSSITVVGENAMENRDANHLEDVLALAPNINFAGSSSRARYFQIRGIGERSQFIDPFNPSVGLYIDGIDMTGLGGAATLFDVNQVEILRGPQGTAFGANALAGAINIESNKPTKETEGYFEAKIGNYHSQGLGGAISGGITDTLQARLSINTFKSNGYIKNTFLGRDDTNNIDERLLRAQLAWQINAENDLHATFFKADIDNGYDAFSLDNTRETYSDEPGEDTQDTNALSLKLQNRSNEFFVVESQLTASETDSTYAYDDDWAYGTYIFNSDDVTYTPDPCDTSLGPCLAEDDGYSGYDEYNRESSRASFDVRLLSTSQGRLFYNSSDWVIGAYSAQNTNDLNRVYTFLASPYSSEIETKKAAIYSEFVSHINATTSIKYGLRIEQSEYDFVDSNGINESDSETLWGGKISYETLVSGDSLAYITLSRGFKAGSVNREPVLSSDLRKYDTEINNTIETGIKSSVFKDQATTALSVFYTQRKDQQIKQSYSYLDDGKPEFVDYYANAAEGQNYGLEAQFNWNMSNVFTFDAAIGLLATELRDYQFQSSDENDNIITIDKSGREQAHAPSYTTLLAGTYHIGNLDIRLETEAKDGFYYSSSHDKQSKSYQLWNASVRYTYENLEVSLIGRNITDKSYAVKGFFFGNDPRDDYADKVYTQKGNPALVSLNVKYNF